MILEQARAHSSPLLKKCIRAAEAWFSLQEGLLHQLMSALHCSMCRHRIAAHSSLCWKPATAQGLQNAVQIISDSLDIFISITEQRLGPTDLNEWHKKARSLRTSSSSSNTYGKITQAVAKVKSPVIFACSHLVKALFSEQNSWQFLTEVDLLWNWISSTLTIS